MLDPFQYLFSTLICAENDPVIINTVTNLITTEDVPSKYKALFACIIKCWDRYKLIEPVALFNEITANYKEDKHRATLLTQLNEVWGLVLLPSFWKHYLTLCLSEIKKNKLKDLGNEYAAMDIPVNVIDSIIHDAQNKINAIEIGYKLNPDRTLSDITGDFLSSLDADITGGNTNKLKTGLSFEKHIRGFRQGDFIIIAGRPKIGKSAVANTITSSLLLQGKRVMLVNNEMDEELVQKRLYSAIYGFSQNQLQTPETISSYTLGNLMSSAEDFQNLPLELYCFAFKTATQIETEAIRLGTLGRKPDIIIIDYLGLFTTAELNRSKYEEISALSWQFKMMAATLKVPVICLAQVNRKCEDRTNKRPVPADLRDSGSLEQDATAILMLYRDEYYNENTDEPNILEINVAVNRNGTSGTDKYHVDFDHMKISNLDSGGYNE